MGRVDGAAADDRIDWSSGGIETQLGWSLTVTVHEFARAGSVAVASVPGGDRGYQVLVAITTEAPSSQLALAHRLGIDKNAMTAVVDLLEAGGHVERRPDPEDRRIRQVIPTPSGRELLATSRVALHDVEVALMGSIDDDEQQQLRHLLARVALGISTAETPSTAAPVEPAAPIGAPHRSDRRRPETDHSSN